MEQIKLSNGLEVETPNRINRIIIKIQCNCKCVHSYTDTSFTKQDLEDMLGLFGDEDE